MFADELRKQLLLVGCQLSDEQLAQLEDHYNLLIKWNRVLNLTRIEEIGQAVRLHYCESLFLGTHLPQEPLKVADVGSGAGFPGIPTAVLRPDCAITLIESHQRKSVFLREATRSLPNVRVLAKRVENLTDTFEWIVSRAVNFSEISQVISRLADNVAILGGEAYPSDRFTWNKVKIPWGHERFLWIGRST